MPPQIPPMAPPAPPSHPRKKIFLIVSAAFLVLLGMFLFISISLSKESRSTNSTYVSPTASVHYLAFQIFTSDPSSKEIGNSIPTSAESVENTVNDIAQAIGTNGTANNKLAFIVGPVSFDNSDEDVRKLIRDSFAIALKTNVAVGFHIDDSMFWGRLSQLNTIQNIEWLDWNKTPNTGRRLDWSSTPTKIMPQLCLNSAAVTDAVKNRAVLIGDEVQKGLATLKTAGKEDLFAGVIAGWETQMGRDFATGNYLGYCALTNKGYSAVHPPADIDQARIDIVKDFITLWTASLANAGVPEGKIYSHVAFMPQINSQENKSSVTYSQMVNFAPPTAALGAHHSPGFSTYPNSWNIGDIEKILADNGNPSWISAEGTALDPGQAELGTQSNSMESYLGGLFNHGAVVVNVYGWGVGSLDNPFRKTAENASAIVAYKKFLAGDVLSEVAASSGDSLPNKIKKIQDNEQSWMQTHQSQQAAVTALMQQLDGYIKANDLVNANKTADAVLNMILF